MNNEWINIERVKCSGLQLNSICQAKSDNSLK